MSQNVSSAPTPVLPNHVNRSGQDPAGVGQEPGLHNGNTSGSHSGAMGGVVPVMQSGLMPGMWSHPYPSMWTPAPSMMPQPSRYLPPSQTLLQRLTQGLDQDQTQPTTAAVKVSQPLQPDGLNLSSWMYDVVNCGVTKNCVEALKQPMPGTRANAAAMTLLISSTPADFHSELTSFPSACEAFAWICSKYQGGHDMTINNEWLRQFTQEGMTREETLEQYVRRKVNLFSSLLANHHQMNPMDLPKYIIDGLPPEFIRARCHCMPLVLLQRLL